MNISGEIFSIHQSNSSGYIFSNGTKVETYFDMFSVMYICSILMSFPTNSYVIWLILTGTGNGLAAEFFLLNLSVCEILVCMETLLIFLSYQFLIPLMLFLDGVAVTSRSLFQCLIGVERYLAVIHPVTFLKFKPLRYKVMCSAVVWVPTIVSGVIRTLNSLVYIQLFFFNVLYIIFFSIQLFCCLAVLRALKQSGPGERGREREEENHMKKRAFYLILIAAVTTVITYTPSITSMLFGVHLAETSHTGMFISFICFALAGLVQPFLFLIRVLKLNFIKCQ